MHRQRRKIHERRRRSGLCCSFCCGILILFYLRIFDFQRLLRRPLLDVIFPLAHGLHKSHLRPYQYTLVMLLVVNCQTCGLERHPHTAPGNQDKLASDFFPRQIIP